MAWRRRISAHQRSAMAAMAQCGVTSLQLAISSGRVNESGLWRKSVTKALIES
jgi:hypothetical protein